MRAPTPSEGTAQAYLALCDAPPEAPCRAQAIRALGRHIPCATLYADQARRCEALATWCRSGGRGADILYAKRHAAWAAWWREMEQAQRLVETDARGAE